MKLLTSKEDFNIDNGYVLNYNVITPDYYSDSTISFKAIHWIEVKDGVYIFIKSLERSSEMGVEIVDGVSEYEWLNYWNEFGGDVDDVHFLLSPDEILIDVVLDEI